MAELPLSSSNLRVAISLPQGGLPVRCEAVVRKAA
jgi:hypothetical protein